MPTINGVSIVGRQVIATGLTTATVASILVNPPGGASYKYWGYFEHVQVAGGRQYSLPGAGASIWYDGVAFSVPGASGGVTRSLVASWKVAGIPWSVTY